MAQADHELDGTETAGAPGFALQTWNNIGVGSGGTNSTAQIFPSTALSDGLGNTAVATLSTSVNSTWFVGYAASSAANANELNLAGHDDDLFNSYLALNGPSGDGSPSDAAVLQVSGLGAPYTVNGYSLVIYSETDRSPGGSGTRRSVFTVTPAGGASTSVFTEDDSASTTPNTFSGTYVLSDGVDDGADYSNHVILTGLSAASFRLLLMVGGEASVVSKSSATEPPWILSSAPSLLMMPMALWWRGTR